VLAGLLVALVASNSYRVTQIPGMEAFVVPSVYGVDDVGNAWGADFDIGKKQPYVVRGGSNVVVPLPDGDYFLEPTFLNPAGILVGEAIGEGPIHTAFVFRDGKTTKLAPLADNRYFGALSVNRNGIAVGWSGTADIIFANDASHQSAVIWSSPIPRQIVLPKDWKLPVATAINDNGVIAGYARVNNKDLAWVLENEEARLLGSDTFRPIAINAHGDIAGNTNISGHNRGAVWRDGAIFVLPPADGFSESAATAISENGTVVGSSQHEWRDHGDGPADAAPYDSHATVWAGSKPVDLNQFASGMKRSTILSNAIGINRAGVVVGETSINLQLRGRIVEHVDHGTFIATPN